MTLDKMIEALETYAIWNGSEHDEECPADDTCSCSLKWVNDGVNESIRYLRRQRRQAEATARPAATPPHRPSCDSSG